MEKNQFTAPNIESETIEKLTLQLMQANNELQKMQKDAVVLDIASKPGGTDFEAAKKLGISAKLALGLPGIYSTKSSACLYQKAMWKYAPLRELEKGEES